LRSTALLALLLAVGRAAAQDPPAEPVAPIDASTPTSEQIDSALARVKADPNLATERTVSTLRWRSSEAQGVSDWAAGLFAVLRWILGLFEWLAQGGRLVFWVVLAVLAAMLAVHLGRGLRPYGKLAVRKKFVAPSHVRDLDIRPESLPDDIGRSAAALWNRGEQRAALALLYRGLLSRLVHAHGVPIRDSSTEGDCLALAAARVSAARNAYAARLVRVWQGAVYGTEHPSSEAVLALCDEFARVLDLPIEPSSSATAGAAA
jgi:hypothetical protein